MKKLLLVLFALSLLSEMAFCKKRETLRLLTPDMMQAAEETYGIEKFKIPTAEIYDTLDDKMISFADYNLKGGTQTVDSIVLTQKKKRYIIKIQDAQTTVSYGWEAYFKLINDENKVVQVIHKKDMEDSVYALYDCDFDGYDDLVFFTDKEKKGTTYHVYYWNQTKKMFEKKADELLSPYFDKKHKLVVTSQITGDAENLYEYYRYVMGGRKFVARVRITLPDGKPDTGISLAYTEKKKANFETDAGVYLYDLLSVSELNKQEPEIREDLIRQYDALMKKINAIK